jgi:PAS domain S-box-containing protein
MVFEQGTVLYDESRKPIGMFGTTQDVTERKIAEKELQIAQQKFRAIFDNTADGIYQSTTDGKFIMANPSMAKIFGYDSPEEMISTVTNIGRQLYADPVERNKMAEQIIANGHVENYEVQVLTKTQDVIWVSANIRAVKNEEGTIIFFEGTLEDITERKNAEEEILQLNKNLDQFANITAHDLQEPIRMVSGFLGLLEKKYSDVVDEQGKSYIYRAKDGADRMSILIRDLLEFSRSGNKAAKKSQVNLSEVMDLVNKDLSIVVADTNTSLHVPDDLPVINGTHSALYRLFLNLISNGIKFRKKDTAPEINLTVNELDDCWEFKLTDNGIGVAQKDQPKLFQAFQRLHRRDEYPGTGLGLVTCKKIVETHGGRIWMTSEPGEGTTFHFTITKASAAA